MKKRYQITIIAASLSVLVFLTEFSSSEVWAQANTTRSHKTGIQSVQVSGMRDQDWKPYRTLLKGLDAYEANRFMAPDTEFKFVLRPQESDIDLSQIQLKVLGETLVLPVSLAEDGSFFLPRNQLAFDENAELVLNQRQNKILDQLAKV